MQPFVVDSFLVWLRFVIQAIKEFSVMITALEKGEMTWEENDLGRSRRIL
ncbi:MAG: hypothetical protein HC820_00880 [Hydrococcus sp. RM1_1_31]|nr:hypothetical protein [Hydrococcus sp. RM1_1_31]